ncbi:UNVERIFIED_CONTAM: hypothetical protein HDU68_003679, partial [Siphonaria sp. JEL0065]
MSRASSSSKITKHVVKAIHEGTEAVVVNWYNNTIKEYFGIFQPGFWKSGEE